MHVNARKAAFGGLMLAMTEVCIALGSMIEMNTLFLLAASSYFVGIMVREMGMKTGAAFYFAGVLLGFLIGPNKFYVCSYAAMGLYILLDEGICNAVGKMSGGIQKKKMLFWILKILAFNTIYLVVLIAGWKVFFAGNIVWEKMAGFIVAGQIGFLFYDKAYEYVQSQLWAKMRGRIFLLQ